MVENPYPGLRQQFLGLNAGVVDAPLRGAALELGMLGGSATVACVADGTTSLYISSGGGHLGMGEREPVRRANVAFLAAVGSGLDALAAAVDVPLPGDGEVNIVAVTAEGLRLLQCAEAEARDPGSAAYPLYAAGQEVITQIRIVADELGH